MNFLNWTNGVWEKLFKKEIKEKFGVNILLSSDMELWIEKFYQITSGHPMWEDTEDDIESINFAGFIDDVTAGLVTLDAKIQMPDTPRGKMLQESADYVLKMLPDKVSEGLGNVGIMFKPNGKNVDYVEAGNFFPTEKNSNGDILGCVFQDHRVIGEYTYVRLEYHRFEVVNGLNLYRITNIAIKKKGMFYRMADLSNSLTRDFDSWKPCELSEVADWANLDEDIALENVKKPLFVYFKNPSPNRIDRTSPFGVPIWHNCMKELKDLDIAWGRKSGEVQDSKHITFLPESAIRFANLNDNMKLPRFIRGMQVGGSNLEDGIHEHVSTLLTEQRIADINSILSMISTKCGFSQGTFTFDEKQGLKTATEIESDDQETIRTIKNIRDALKECLENLFYALNAFADRYYSKYELPAEDWEKFKEDMVIDFADITYNKEEDKMFAYQLSQNGYMPKAQFLVEHCGRTPEEAEKMVADAKKDNETDEGLFGEE